MGLIILRWVALLPGALIGAVVVRLFVRLVFWAGGLLLFGEESLWEKILNTGFEAFAFGAGFVIIATLIAPNHKVFVVLAAIGFHLLLSGAGLYSAIITGDNWLLYEDIVAIAGAIAGGIHMLRSLLDDDYDELDTLPEYESY